MRKSLIVLFLLAGLVFAQTAKKKTTKSAAATPAPTVMTPDKINWGDPPPVLAPGAKMAVLSGNPNGPGEFVVRLRMPGRLQDHAALASHAGRCDGNLRRVPRRHGR